PLARFSVSLAPGAPVRLEQCEDDPSEPERWTLAALDPDPDYVAAIAIDGRPRRMVCHTSRGIARRRASLRPRARAPRGLSACRRGRQPPSWSGRASRRPRFA